jgi:PadR family transcriptional regulator PadR
MNKVFTERSENIMMLNLWTYELFDSERGPQRKYYALTKIGNSVLKQFTERNIKLFQNKSLISILNK